MLNKMAKNPTAGISVREGVFRIGGSVDRLR